MKKTEHMEAVSRLDKEISRQIQYRVQLVEILAGDGRLDEDMDGFARIDELPVKDVTVVYQGVEGAFSHQAMLQFFGRDVKALRTDTFEQAVKAVVSGEADYGVLPVENTTGGTVGDVLDLQMKYDCFAVAEVDLPIRHSLLALPGTKEEDIRRIWSHPQAISQCQRFLEEHPAWDRIPDSNTAAAARRVAEGGDPSSAALASSLCAELYGLEVLRDNVATNTGNTTRFFVLTRKKIYCREAGMIRICFECKHETGNLYRLLSHLTHCGLNMTKIESRPAPDRNFEYRFFVEFEGNLSDPVVCYALRGLRRDALTMKILGNML